MGRQVVCSKPDYPKAGGDVNGPPQLPDRRMGLEVGERAVFARVPSPSTARRLTRGYHGRWAFRLLGSHRDHTGTRCLPWPTWDTYRGRSAAVLTVAGR